MSEPESPTSERILDDHDPPEDIRSRNGTDTITGEQPGAAIDDHDADDVRTADAAGDDSPETRSDRSIHDDILDGDRSDRPTARERRLPQDEFLIYDRLTRESTLAQDTLGFDYVREDGIIVDGDHYVGLVGIHPRNWLVLNDEERIAVFRAFDSFLLGLNYPIQILSIPREFDVSKHTSLIRIADSQTDRHTESPILRHGRQRQVAWMHNTIDTMSVKDREFYVACRVRSEHVRATPRTDTPLHGVPVLGELVAELSRISRSLRRHRTKTHNEERCVTEVRARQNELSETLTKTGVSTRIVADRDETMDVLYRYYNHVESPFETYTHATYTDLLSSALGTEYDR